MWTIVPSVSSTATVSDIAVFAVSLVLLVHTRVLGPQQHFPSIGGAAGLGVSIGCRHIFLRSVVLLFYRFSRGRKRVAHVGYPMYSSLGRSSAGNTWLCLDL